MLICVHCVLSAFHNKLSFGQNTEELFLGNFERPSLFAAGVPDDGHALDPAWCLEAKVLELLGERMLNAELAFSAAPEQKVLGVPARPRAVLREHRRHEFGKLLLVPLASPNRIPNVEELLLARELDVDEQAFEVADSLSLQDHVHAVNVHLRGEEDSLEELHQHGEGADALRANIAHVRAPENVFLLIEVGDELVSKDMHDISFHLEGKVKAKKFF